MKKIKEEKGSIAAYVSIVLISFLFILSAVYITSVSVRKIQLSTVLKVKESYELENGNVENIYEKQLLKKNQAEGLMLYYDAINNVGFGHSENTNVWKDLSGNENDGMLIGSPIWQDDGLILDGKYDYVNVGVAGLNQLTNGTVIVMCGVDDWGNENSTIFYKGSSAEENKNHILIARNGDSTTAIRTSIADGSNSTQDNTKVAAELDKKMCIAMTWNGSLLKSYKDGILKETTSTTIIPSQESAVCYIGKGYKDSSVFNGTIQAVLVYNRALTDDEINKVYTELNERKTEEETTGSVLGVRLNRKKVNIGQDISLTLEATIVPDNATNKKVTWKSENEEIATVDKDGIITGVNKGTTTIIAITEDGKKTAECEVNVYPLVTSITTFNHASETTVDRLGNLVQIPGKFRYVTGETVQKGIVIEDSDLNQFVWVPVSNIDGDNKITGTEADDELIRIENAETNTIEEVEITLGRYDTFSEAAEPKQLGKDYADGANDKYIIGSYYKELNTSTNPEGVASSGTDGKNAIFQTLGNFVTSVEKYNGYYIARYEASYESGSGTNFSTYKMASRKSTSVSQSTTNDWANTQGRLWHWITQINASKVARNMYNTADEESEFVVSDLINSYMWDTALIFITKVEDNSYHDDFDGNGTLRNTGETTDVKCNIYDMKGNLRELTTEYSTYSSGSNAEPCVDRGGTYFYSYYYTSTHYDNKATYSSVNIGFRAGLYCTTEN